MELDELWSKSKLKAPNDWCCMSLFANGLSTSNSPSLEGSLNNTVISQHFFEFKPVTSRVRWYTLRYHRNNIVLQNATSSIIRDFSTLFRKREASHGNRRHEMYRSAVDGQLIVSMWLVLNEISHSFPFCAHCGASCGRLVDAVLGINIVPTTMIILYFVRVWMTHWSLQLSNLRPLQAFLTRE